MKKFKDIFIAVLIALLGAIVFASILFVGYHFARARSAKDTLRKDTLRHENMSFIQSESGEDVSEKAKTLGELLVGRREEDSRQAREEAFRLGKAAIPEIKKFIEECSDVQERFHGIGLLAELDLRLKSSESVPFLIASLEEANWIPESAGSSLFLITSKHYGAEHFRHTLSVIEPIYKMDYEDVKQWRQWWQTNKNGTVQDWLLDGLDDPLAEVRYYAACRLGAFKEAEVVNRLLDSLDDVSEYVRAQAVFSLEDLLGRLLDFDWSADSKTQEAQKKKIVSYWSTNKSTFDFGKATKPRRLVGRLFPAEWDYKRDETVILTFRLISCRDNVSICARAYPTIKVEFEDGTILKPEEDPRRFRIAPLKGSDFEKLNAGESFDFTINTGSYDWGPKYNFQRKGKYKITGIYESNLVGYYTYREYHEGMRPFEIVPGAWYGKIETNSVEITVK